jgi:hypothetical protein
MVAFAKEAGQVGGDRIDQQPAFGISIPAFKDVAVSREIIDAERPQPRRQPPIDQVALAIGENNSGMRLDQLCDSLEVVVTQREFLLSNGLHVLSFAFKGTPAVSCDTTGGHGLGAGS